jgi:AAA+ superfamily predicted ATPase
MNPGWILVGLALAAVTAIFYARKRGYLAVPADRAQRSVAESIRAHFHPVPLDQVTISERRFPFRVRADLQKGIERLFSEDTKVLHFCGVRKEYAHDGLGLSDCMVRTTHTPALSVPPQYEGVDTGDDQPIACLKNGLWFLEKRNCRYVVLLSPAGSFGQITGVQFQIATVNQPEGTRIAEEFFRRLEESVSRADSYRGKVLSLEMPEHSYSGESTGITVHRLRTVERQEVILPARTLDLLDRNVIGFVSNRGRLARFRQSTKKGLLFYGPPGTGKTHTIHYLARALPGHTTLLISAEQVALLAEYMTLARLLQPSVVVLEDVDLIARERTEMGSPCEEVLLNKLLNEMDGLKEDAEILFLLTTNRPESLERALSARPGRIDQAIEFPLPDEEGREKLVRLYSKGVEMPDEVSRTIVRRTDGVSAAFIKELMRRAVQFHIERNGEGCIGLSDVENALDEMLFRGGSLNLKLLGASAMETEVNPVANG